jgi:hypothetical protein
MAGAGRARPLGRATTIGSIAVALAATLAGAWAEPARAEEGARPDRAPASAPGQAVRATRALAAAEAALTASDLDGAAAAFSEAWVLVVSPLFEAGWRGHADERSALAARIDLGRRRLATARAWPDLVAAQDAARAAIDAAKTKTASRPARAPWQRARERAEACVAAAAGATLDPTWPVPGAGGAQVKVGDLAQACATLVAEAVAADQAQAEALAARDAELRKLLKRDRLAAYEAHGEPECACGSGSPREIAKAKVWRFVSGPDGPLATYQTLELTFNGDRLVGQRARISHERP